MLSGKNLLIVPNRLIVQSSRGTHWKKSDPDSILVLEFSKTPRWRPRGPGPRKCSRG